MLQNRLIAGFNFSGTAFMMIDLIHPKFIVIILQELTLIILQETETLAFISSMDYPRCGLQGYGSNQ